jgi:hypothetical protein
VAARAVQGIGGAIVQAVALSMILDLFGESGDRAKAMSVWGFVSSAGGAVGVVLGGVLTQAGDWHLIFLLNVPIGLIAIALARPLLPVTRGLGLGTGVDVGGALTITAALTTSVTKPTQSHALQVLRQRATYSDRHNRKIPASRKMGGIIASSPRTNGATRDAITAPAIHQRDGVTSARRIRKSERVDQKYANGSSTIIDEYATAGIAADAAATKSAGLRPTNRRASPYAGNTVAVITITVRYFTVAYAEWRLWISQAGASTYVQSVVNEYGCPRRAAWPVSAIARESCVSSSSSPKSQGVLCAQAWIM